MRQLFGRKDIWDTRGLGKVANLDEREILKEEEA